MKSDDENFDETPESEAYLSGFCDWLAKKGLGKSEAKDEFGKALFFVQLYLADLDIPVKEGPAHADAFFMDDFVADAIGGDEEVMKQIADTMVRFYTYMNEIGEVPESDVDKLQKTIKSNMPKWLKAMEAYWDEVADDDLFDPDFDPEFLEAFDEFEDEVVEFDMPEVKIETWQKAYDLADQYIEEKPWIAIGELDLVGFTHPQTDKPAFVIFTNPSDSSCDMLVLPDIEAYYRLKVWKSNPIRNVPSDILLVERLFMTFVDADDLEDYDLDLIDNLEKIYKGKGSFPCFRSQQASMIPWFPEEEELQLMIHAIQLVLDRLPGVPHSEQELKEALQNNTVCFLDDDDYSLKEVPDEISRTIHMPAPQLIMEARKWPRVDRRIEVTRNVISAPVNAGDRPYFESGLFAIDRETGEILGHEMLEPIDGYEEVMEETPSALLELLGQHETLPSTILLNDSWLMAEVKPVCDILNIGIKMQELKYADTVSKGLEQFLNEIGL